MKNAVTSVRQLVKEIKAEGAKHSEKVIRRVILADMHRQLTEEGVPRSENRQRLGLRKRLQYMNAFLENLYEGT